MGLFLSRKGSFIGLIGGDVTVRVVYSDESGVGDKREPITVVTAIILNMDRAWKSVHDALDDFVLKTPDNLLEVKSNGARVIKGRTLFSAIRKSLPTADEKLREVLQIVVDNGIAVCYGAVDREEFRKLHERDADIERRVRGSEQTTYDHAFEQCLRRIDAHARQFTNESVLWIAERSDSQREPSTRMIHRVFQLHEEQKVGDEFWTVLRQESNPISVVDTIYFGDPGHSLALQLADVCCATVAQYLLDKHYGWATGATPYYELIRNCVISHGAPPDYLRKP